MAFRDSKLRTAVNCMGKEILKIIRILVLDFILTITAVVVLVFITDKLGVYHKIIHYILKCRGTENLEGEDLAIEIVGIFEGFIFPILFLCVLLISYYKDKKKQRRFNEQIK